MKKQTKKTSPKPRCPKCDKKMQKLVGHQKIGEHQKSHKTNYNMKIELSKDEMKSLIDYLETCLAEESNADNVRIISQLLRKIYGQNAV